MNEDKTNFLNEFNEKSHELFQELGEKYGIDLNDQLFFAYFVGLGNGEEEDHFTVNAVCGGMDEMNWMLEKITEQYEEASLDGLLGDIYLN